MASQFSRISKRGAPTIASVLIDFPDWCFFVCVSLQVEFLPNAEMSCELKDFVDIVCGEARSQQNHFMQFYVMCMF